MVNIITLLFTFLLLVTQNILLLNEESLILLCFIVFVILTFNNLRDTFNNSFNIQVIQLKDSLTCSFKQILKLINLFISLKNLLNNVHKNFLILKNYYIKFNIILTSFAFNYNKFILQTYYKKRLAYLNKVEEQTIKFLTIVLLTKLLKITKTKRFYKYIIKSPQFLCLELISLRERIFLTKKSR